MRELGGKLTLKTTGPDDRNAEFIDEMIKDPVFSDMLDSPSTETISEVEAEHSHNQSHSHTNGGRGGLKQGERDSSQEKVRSTLRSFVRDWSDLGKPERDACYIPILEALGREFPEGRAGKKVLIPGCGLGRLAMEIAAMGRFFIPLRFNVSIWLPNRRQEYGQEEKDETEERSTAREDIANDRFRGTSQRIQHIHVDRLQFRPQPVRPPKQPPRPS